MTAKSQKVPPGGRSDPRRLADSLNRVIDGRLDAYGEVTLNAGVTSTVFSSPAVAANSTPILFPTTANAAAALSTTYLISAANGSLTFGHLNNAQTDRTFRVAWIG